MRETIPNTLIAGRLKNFVDRWRQLTSDPVILSYIMGVKIEFIDTKPSQAVAKTRLFNIAEKDIIENEIKKLLVKGVVIPSTHEPGEFISSIFLRCKKDGSYRMILNLKQFNEFVQHHHFKMDTLDEAIRMMKPGCYMASIDLTDAYYMVPVHQDDQKYLEFEFMGSLYQYTCLPNGLSSAPRIFTKLLKPLYSTLHSMGHLSSGYMDDSYLQGDTPAECNQNISDTTTLVTELGFIPHPTKSVTVPTQVLVFLGFILNSVDMTVSPTQEKIQKTEPTIQQVAEVSGLLVSNFPGVEYAALKVARGDYYAKLTLSGRCKQELKWWIENLPHSIRRIIHSAPFATIQSDASTAGWGAVRGDSSTGGRWSTLEQQAHINVLELKAAFFGLRSLCTHDKDVHIQLQLDNTTALAYLNKMGGTQSRPLNDLAYEIWQWCIERNIWLSAVHIPGKVNVEADKMSRVFHDNNEWKLNTKMFKIIS